MVRSGRVRVNFYSSDKVFLEHRILETGDVILLCGGGHSFEMLEETSMIEIKQGPYMGEEDKTRFDETRCPLSSGVNMIPVCQPYLNGNELKYVDDAVRTGWISLSGKYVKAFEEAFAAFCYVGESVTDPAKYYRNNVANTLNLLEAMVEKNVSNFIFSSSCATYGEPVEIPITEQHPQNPINPYGRTKLVVEQILDDFKDAYGLESVCLRYFNAAGADPDGELGEDHEPETHLIPLVLQAALGQRAAINIFGDDYPTRDGTCIRDYIHIIVDYSFWKEPVIVTSYVPDSKYWIKYKIRKK